MAINGGYFAAACTLAFDRVTSSPANNYHTSQVATKQATGAHKCEYKQRKYANLHWFRHKGNKWRTFSCDKAILPSLAHSWHSSSKRLLYGKLDRFVQQDPYSAVFPLSAAPAARSKGNPEERRIPPCETMKSSSLSILIWMRPL